MIQLGEARADVARMSLAQLVEWHALHQQAHFKRRIEELRIAIAPHLKEAGQRQLFREFEQYARGDEADQPAPEQTESEMPLSAQDFARMMKEQHG